MNVGSKTVNIGIAKTMFVLLFLKKVCISRVLNMITVAVANIVSSVAMFIGLSILV